MINITIVRHTTNPMQIASRFTIDIANLSCECGQWQEHGYPCVDALAFFRLHQKVSMTYVLAKLVDRQHTYETERQLLRDNIYPVCMEAISSDGTTLPPLSSTKRSSGRPKKQRIRNRSHFANPELSPIVCSKCHKRGHNTRTCIARSAKEAEKQTVRKTSQADDMMGLDLS